MNDGKIHNQQGIRQIIAFESLHGLFPRNITPTDMDFAVEIGGHFLIGEFKHEKAPFVPKGQRMALERLVRRLGEGSVVFIAVHRSRQEDNVDAASCRVVEWMSGSFPQWQECNCSVRTVCQQWLVELPKDV